MGSHQSGPWLPVLKNGSFDGGSSLLLCEPRKPEHAARARQNISAILRCKCCSRGIPTGCQFNIVLARAVFIDICCFHHCIRKQKEGDVQKQSPGQVPGSCTPCVSVYLSWSTWAICCCTYSKHRGFPLSSLLHLFLKSIFKPHSFPSPTHTWAYCMVGFHLQYIGDSNPPWFPHERYRFPQELTPGDPGTWADTTLCHRCPSQKQPASPFIFRRLPWIKAGSHSAAKPRHSGLLFVRAALKLMMQESSRVWLRRKGRMCF